MYKVILSIFILFPNVVSAIAFENVRMPIRLKVFRNTGSGRPNTDNVYVSNRQNLLIGTMNKQKKLLEESLNRETPKIISNNGRIGINPCSCKEAHCSVHELNTMRRYPLMIDDVHGENKIVGSDYCSICSDKYDYNLLEIQYYSTSLDFIVHHGIKGLLEYPKSYVLRPLLLGLVMLSGAISWNIINFLVHSKCFSQLLFMMTAVMNNIQFMDLFSVTNNVASIGAYIRKFWFNFRDQLVHAANVASNVPAFSSASKTIIFPRILTSRWFWQHHHIWSIVQSFPLILDLFLFKLIIDSSISMFHWLEKSTILGLVIWESYIIDRNLNHSTN